MTDLMDDMLKAEEEEEEETPNGVAGIPVKAAVDPAGTTIMA
jgi:hypothetical protein